MDKKSKLMTVFFVLVILVSVFFTYQRSFVYKDFIITEEEAEEEVSE